MELTEIITIFIERKKIFFSTVVGCLVLGVGYFVLQGDAYRTELVLNVTRNGTQKTDQYRYDDFYRLQADERFADTIVRWIGSPVIAKQIKDTSGGATLVGNIKASRLSSQMIDVSYVTQDVQSGKTIADATVRIVNDKIAELDAKQQEQAWFFLAHEEPLVESANISFVKIALGALLIGMFAGFWAVLFAHYFKKGRKV